MSNYTSRSSNSESKESHNVRGIFMNLFNSGERLKLGRKHRPDYMLIVLIIVLALFGLVTLFSIAPAVTRGDGIENFMIRQGLLLIAGIIVFFVVSKVPLDFWRRWGKVIFTLALALCFLLPIMGFFNIPLAVCQSEISACRWYSLGPIGSFQPAEFLKFGTVVFASGFLAVQFTSGKLNSWRSTILPLGVVMAAVLFIIVVMQKDLGTGVALAAIVLVQLLVAGVKWRNLAIITVIIVFVGVLSIISSPHRLSRIATFFGRGSKTENYQVEQAAIALGSGGLTGRGLGQSIQAFGWLPEAIHDSIFAVFGEMFGFIGVMGLLLVFAALLKRIIDKIDFTESIYLRLVVAGVFGWLFAHIVMNIGAMAQIVPLKGITLPLVSFGGTSMLFIMSSLGLVFAISRYTVHRKIDIQEGAEHADPVRGRRFGRPHYANRSGR